MQVNSPINTFYISFASLFFSSVDFCQARNTINNHKITNQCIVSRFREVEPIITYVIFPTTSIQENISCDNLTYNYRFFISVPNIEIINAIECQKNYINCLDILISNDSGKGISSLQSGYKNIKESTNKIKLDGDILKYIKMSTPNYDPKLMTATHRGDTVYIFDNTEKQLRLRCHFRINKLCTKYFYIKNHALVEISFDPSAYNLDIEYKLIDFINIAPLSGTKK